MSADLQSLVVHSVLHPCVYRQSFEAFCIVTIFHQLEDALQRSENAPVALQPTPPQYQYCTDTSAVESQCRRKVSVFELLALGISHLCAFGRKAAVRHVLLLRYYNDS